MLINNIVGLSNIIVEAQTKTNRIALGVVNTATVKEAAIYDNVVGGYCNVSITGTRISIKKVPLLKGLQKLLTDDYTKKAKPGVIYVGQEIIKNVTTTRYELSNQKYNSTPDLYKPESPIGSVPKELTPLLDQCITDAGFKTLDSQFQVEKVNFEKTIKANDVKKYLYIDMYRDGNDMSNVTGYDYGNIYDLTVIDEKSGDFCRVKHEGLIKKEFGYTNIEILKSKEKLNMFKPTKNNENYNLNAYAYFEKLYYAYSKEATIPYFNESFTSETIDGKIFPENEVPEFLKKIFLSCLENNGIEKIKSNYKNFLTDDKVSYFPIIDKSKNIYLENEYNEEFGNSSFSNYVFSVINLSSGTFCTAHHSPIGLIYKYDGNGNNKYIDDGKQINGIYKGSIPLKYLKNKSEYTSPIEIRPKEDSDSLTTFLYVDKNPLANKTNYNFKRFFNTEFVISEYVKDDKRTFNTNYNIELKELKGREIERIKIPDLLIDMLDNCLSDNGLKTNQSNFGSRYQNTGFPKSVEKYIDKPIIYTNNSDVDSPNKYNYFTINMNNAQLCNVSRAPYYESNTFKVSRSYLNYDQLTKARQDVNKKAYYFDLIENSITLATDEIDSEAIYYSKPDDVDINYKNTVTEVKKEMFKVSHLGYQDDKTNIPGAVMDLLNKCNDNNAFEGLKLNKPANLFSFEINYPAMSQNIMYIKDTKFFGNSVYEGVSSTRFSIIDKNTGVTCNIDNDLRTGDPIYKNESIFKGIIPKKYLAQKFINKEINKSEKDNLMDYYSMSEADPYKLNPQAPRFSIYAESIQNAKYTAEKEDLIINTRSWNIAGFITSINQIPKDKLDKLNKCMKPDGMNEIRLSLEKVDFTKYKPTVTTNIIFDKLFGDSAVDPSITYEKGIQKLGVFIDEPTAVKFEYEITSDINGVTQNILTPNNVQDLVNGKLQKSIYDKDLPCGKNFFYVKIRLINSAGQKSEWSDKSIPAATKFCYVIPVLKLTNRYDPKYSGNYANDQILTLEITGEPLAQIDFSVTGIEYKVDTKVPLDKQGKYTDKFFYRINCNEISKVVGISAKSTSQNKVKTESKLAQETIKDCGYKDSSTSILEKAINVDGKEADKSDRYDPKKGVNFASNSGTDVFLRFIDSSDRDKYKDGYKDDREVFIVTHGYRDKILYFGPNSEKLIPEDIINQNSFTSIAKTIKRYNKDAIVLVLDWSNISYGSELKLSPNCKKGYELNWLDVIASYLGKFARTLASLINSCAATTASDLNKAATYINPTAQEVKKRLVTWGLKSGNKLNIAGHSLGTLMAHELGREYNGINNMVLMDPASDWTEVSSKMSLTTNKLKNLSVEQFTKYSNHSIALIGRSSISGNEGLAKSATESYWNSIDDLNIDPISIHAYTYTTLLAMSNSEVLKLNNIPVLTFNDYNKNSYISRSFERDKSKPPTPKSECSPNFVINNGTLNCNTSYNGKKDVIGAPIYGKNEWNLLDYEGHNGVIVSKKLPSNVSPGSRPSTSGEIQYGAVNILNAATKKTFKQIINK